MRVFISGEFRKNLASLSRLFVASANRRFKFEKRSQLFIRSLNAAHYVVIRVCDESDNDAMKILSQT